MRRLSLARKIVIPGIAPAKTSLGTRESVEDSLASVNEVSVPRPNKVWLVPRLRELEQILGIPLRGFCLTSALSANNS